jgi:hypothetical protein
MIVRTSAKSRLMRPGIVIRSVMPWTPWRRTLYRDQVGDALDALAEDVVGLAEGVEDARAALDDA